MESKPLNAIKILYSYGGKILPRSTDGELRYVGGHTRVLSVDRSISFSGPFIRILFSLSNFTIQLFRSSYLSIIGDVLQNWLWNSKNCVVHLRS
jgi:hypothetical protein